MGHCTAEIGVDIDVVVGAARDFSKSTDRRNVDSVGYVATVLNEYAAGACSACHRDGPADQAVDSHSGGTGRCNERVSAVIGDKGNTSAQSGGAFAIGCQVAVDKQVACVRTIARLQCNGAAIARAS